MFRRGGGLCYKEKELLVEGALVPLLNGLHGCVCHSAPGRGPATGRVLEYLI